MTLNQHQPVLVDQCGTNVVLTLMDGNAGLDIEITPEQWAALSAAAEDLEPMRTYRARQSREAAKEAASHHTKGAAA